MAARDIILEYPIMRIADIEIHFVVPSHAIVAFPVTFTVMDREMFVANIQPIWPDVTFHPVAGSVVMTTNGVAIR